MGNEVLKFYEIKDAPLRQRMKLGHDRREVKGLEMATRGYVIHSLLAQKKIAVTDAPKVEAPKPAPAVAAHRPAPIPVEHKPVHATAHKAEHKPAHPHTTHAAPVHKADTHPKGHKK